MTPYSLRDKGEILRLLTEVDYRDLDKIIHLLTQLIQIDPFGVTPYEAWGNAYRQNGDFTQAIVDFNKAIELDPKDDWAYTWRGETYRQKGDFHQRAVDLEKAFELDPELKKLARLVLVVIFFGKRVFCPLRHYLTLPQPYKDY